MILLSGFRKFLFPAAPKYDLALFETQQYEETEEEKKILQLARGYKLNKKGKTSSKAGDLLQLVMKEGEYQAGPNKVLPIYLKDPATGCLRFSFPIITISAPPTTQRNGRNKLIWALISKRAFINHL